MTATDAQGRTISFDSPDGSTPSEEQLSQMFSVKYGNTSDNNSLKDKFEGMKQTADSLIKFSGTGITQLATGKSLQDRALEAKTQNIPTSTSAPYDANLEAAKDSINQFNQVGSQAAAGAVGQVADMATSPIGLAVPASKLIGATGEAIGAGLTGAGRYFSRIKNSFNPQAVKNLNVPLTTRAGNLTAKSQETAQSEIKPIQENIDATKQQVNKNLQDINYQAKDLSTTTRLAIQDSRRVLKQNVTKITADLQTVAEKGAVDFQEKLPDFFDANSQAYGNARDIAITKMAQEGEGITYQEVTNAIQKTRQDIADALVPSDAPAMKAIDLLEQKYSINQEVTPSSILDASGKPIAEQASSRASGFVDANELIQDLRNVKSTLSAGAKSGRTGFNQEDLAVGYLDHNLGDFIKAKVPGFAELQKEYTPVIRAMKQAHTIFKPNQGEFNTVTATNFLKKAGTGRLEAGQERLLGTLEQGSKFSPGVGNITAPVKQVGTKLQQTVQQSQKQIQSLQDNLSAQLKKMDLQKRAIKGSSDAEIAQKQAMIQSRQSQLQKRLSELEGTKQEIIRLEANKKAANLIKTAISGGVGLGAAYETYRVFKK